MKIDLGMPLQGKELDTYYVDANVDQMEQFERWLGDSSKTPLLLSGQIGSGKSTFLEKAYKVTGKKPDIKLKFDTDVVSHTLGGFMGYLYSKLSLFYRQSFQPTNTYEQAYGANIQILENSFTVKQLELIGDKIQMLSSLHNITQLGLFETGFDQYKFMVESMLGTFRDQDIVIVAEGIDKYELTSPAFIALDRVLDCLKKSKTVFETNITHYIKDRKGRLVNTWNNCERILIGTAEYSNIKEALQKRLDLSANQHKFALPALAVMSGGNFRQAIRLLREYYPIKEKALNKRLEQAVKRTRNSLLHLQNLNMWQEIFQQVEKDHHLAGGTIQDSKDAIYGNLLLIEKDEDGTLPCQINPLIRDLARVLKNELPKEPETIALRNWAEANEVSTIGLDSDTEHLNGLMTEYEQPAYNIHGVFEKLSDQLLGREQGITLIVYHDYKTAKVANKYMQGHAATYRMLKFNYSGAYKIKKLKEILWEGDNIDVYNYFIENYQQGFLESLDQMRDHYKRKSMVWWIEHDKLFDCLNYWPHLRQFLKVYILKEEILPLITKEEVENDIELISEVGYEDEEVKAYQEQLTEVLNRLKDQE
ncbi:MAG: hypothetical protein N4A71_13690 [Carboxylicivirga sp.]|jgi:nucleoside-triphosphatase THEP1|nr:hypothetical protein [Carboxylicivirga sp.]